MDKTDKTEEKQPVAAVSKYRRPLLIGAVVVAVIVIFMAGMVVDRAARHNRAGFKVGPVAKLHGGLAGRRFRGGAGASTNNQNHLSGVVTAVNGSSFTLAGDGATNTITTNSSTKYTNGSSVAVNDTVTVLGSVNGGTFTASQVVINP